MSIGNEIIRTAFFETGMSAPARVGRMDKLAELVIVNYDPVDEAAMAAIPAYRELLEDGDPAVHAAEIFERSQKISNKILNSEYRKDISRNGVSSELAVYNLAWWGIATQGLGRYARIATYGEDESSSTGRRNGYDLVIRTENRRQKIQVKTFSSVVKPLAYRDDIVTLSPAQLLQDPDALDIDLHEAISLEDTDMLARALGSLTREMRTQKAPNGYRKVI